MKNETKTNTIYKPSYSHIIEDYLRNQSNIVLDRNNWVWLDFEGKTMIYGAMCSPHNEPATIWEYIAFMRHFKLMGCDFCTFAQMRSKGCKFDFRRKKNRKYALIEVDKSLFSEFLETKTTAQEAWKRMFDYFLNTSDQNYYTQVCRFLKKELQNAEKSLKRFQK